MPVSMSDTPATSDERPVAKRQAFADRSNRASQPLPNHESKSMRFLSLSNAESSPPSKASHERLYASEGGLWYSHVYRQASKSKERVSFGIGSLSPFGKGLSTPFGKGLREWEDEAITDLDEGERKITPRHPKFYPKLYSCCDT